MTDLEKMVEKRADNYANQYVAKPRNELEAWQEEIADDFKAGATDPVIRKAIELRERIRFGKQMRPDVDDRCLSDYDREIEQAEAELAQLMAGIEGEP